MSVSEKLKALDDRMVGRPWLASEKRIVEMEHRSTIAVLSDWYASETDAQLIAAVRNALPQIVAVVERAEQPTKTAEGLTVCRMCGWMSERGHAPTCPLAALEEALS